jgi:hypothetical protein
VIPGERSAWRGGEHHGRNPQLRIVAVFAAIFVVLAAIAVAIALLSEPAGLKPVCSTPVCAAPPRAPSPGGIGTSAPSSNLPGQKALTNAAPALLTGQQTYTSPGLGYSFEYPPGLGVAQSSANGVTLVNGTSPDLVVYVIGASASGATPQDAQQQLLSDLGQQIPNLAPVDPNSAEAIPAAALGGHAGVGGFYQGFVDSPQGPQTPVDLAILASTDGRATIGVAIESLNRAQTAGRFRAMDLTMFDSFRFGGDIVP